MDYSPVAARHGEPVPRVPKGEYEISFINVYSGEQKVVTRSLGKGEVLDSPFEEERVTIMLRKLEI